ncbi:MAG: class I tRNA ligase family protein, partial [Hyphomicrobiales bacterium]
MSRYIVTITPPTPNGDLHLGHLSGPFLGADVCRRALAGAGHDVLFVSYADDYQSYVPRKTEALERDAFEYSDLVRRMMLL